jgi:hypothetical protein
VQSSQQATKPAGKNGASALLRLKTIIFVNPHREVRMKPHSSLGV